jgi:hypothetical protein
MVRRVTSVLLFLMLLVCGIRATLPGALKRSFPRPQKHLTRRLTLRLNSVCENPEKHQR